MRSCCAVLVGLLSACGAEGPRGPEGMQGPPGPQGSTGLPGNGSMITCEPGRAFCDGAKVWACTKSGTDAVLTVDCATDLGPVNSATNPFSCFTSGCADSGFGSRPGPACCRKAKPLCAASLSTHPGLDFSTYWSLIEGRCGIGSGSGCFQNNVPTLDIRRKAGSEQLDVSLWFFPEKIKPGQVVPFAELSALPAACDGMQTVRLTSGGKTCGRWSGSVAWIAPNPSFKVTLDLTCIEMDKTDMKLKGTFEGDI